MQRHLQKSASKTTNYIYLVYETVELNAEGAPGEPGDKHYHCFHGNQKILTVTKLMKGNLSCGTSIVISLF